MESIVAFEASQTLLPYCSVSLANNSRAGWKLLNCSCITETCKSGVSDFPGHAVATKQMCGYGGVLTIEVGSPSYAAAKVVDRLKLFAIAPSLGGVESLSTQPVTTTHYGLSAEELKRRGIN